MPHPSRPLPGLTRRRLLGLAGAGTGAVLLGGCGDDIGTGAAPTGTPSIAGDLSSLPDLSGRRIRVSTFPQNHAAAPLYWPQFAPNGLEVEVRTVPSGTDMNVALEQGELDFALFGLVNGFVQSAEGIGSRVVAMGAEEGASLVVAADSSYETVEDLAGRRIGFKGPAFQYLLLLELLEGAGLDPSADVQLVPVEWNDMPVALARGDVEAYMGTEPNPSRSVADGTGRRLEGIYETPAGRLNSAIWASRRIVEEEPDLIPVAVALQRAAAEQLSPGGENDPDVWRDLTVDQFGYDPAVYEALLPNVGAVWRFDDTWLPQAQGQGRRMASLGLIPEEPDYDAVIQPVVDPPSLT